MSGLAGVWNFDGQPLDERVLRTMSAALSHRGTDGTGFHRIGAAGFAHQRMWVTPEEEGEIQPLARRGIMLAMDGRLDNRDELLDAVRLPTSASDADCALAAYERWADRFVDRLNGDFAIAVFDEPRRHLLLARDAIGVRPLYYVHTDRFCAFASEIKALLAHPGITAAPDGEGIADFMLLASRPMDRQDVTCFTGISSLVPAHVAHVTPGRLVTRRYWDFDTGRTIRLRSFAEYAEAFRASFATAVRRRTRARRPVAVSVSGGLDSSSIFCQARVERAVRTDGCAHVVGISYTGASGGDADESRYLVAIERKYGVAIERFPLEQFQGLTEGVDEQIRAIEAPFPDYLWGVTRELHRRVGARGARVLLSGHWGDQVLFSSRYLVDLFNRLDWLEVRRHLREYGRWFGRGEARVLRQRFVVDVARHNLPRALVRPLKRARRLLSGAARSKSWFSDTFLRGALRDANEPAAIGSGFHSAHARAIYLEARSKYHVHCMEWNNKIGSLHGIDVALPFLDRDLLGFLMAAPGEYQNWKGVPRAILRAAMEGVLPDEVRGRTWKANFTAAVNEGVAQDVAVITRALTPESLAVRLGYCDAAQLAPLVARLSSSATRDNCLDSWDLVDLFGLEVWLQLFSPESRRSHVARSTC